MTAHTQVETFNRNLRQTRSDAAPTQGSCGSSDVRLSEVSSAAPAHHCGTSRPPAPGAPTRAFRADETGAGEYSPPTAVIVTHTPAHWQGGPAKGGQPLGQTTQSGQFRLGASFLPARTRRRASATAAVRPAPVLCAAPRAARWGPPCRASGLLLPCIRPTAAVRPANPCPGFLGG
ncbi:hypothetical protein Ade02nite_78560 [Paractinoplanes deccanensis]|uniref:Uncharacterized protein n=1 Tax=Paractinoplanes deccanensis TaxID=113561 RepID=A0ABQ3YHE8_9ACTN|nr:hypothetical protein Ade02nite_78560 [Actinoplanes deccanensis]